MQIRSTKGKYIINSHPSLSSDMSQNRAASEAALCQEQEARHQDIQTREGRLSFKRQKIVFLILFYRSENIIQLSANRLSVNPIIGGDFKTPARCAHLTLSLMFKCECSNIYLIVGASNNRLIFSDPRTPPIIGNSLYRECLIIGEVRGSGKSRR